MLNTPKEHSGVEQIIVADTIESNSPHVSSAAIMLDVHPKRAELYEELHNRPYTLLDTPCCVTHIAMLVTPDQRKAEKQHLVELCQRFAISPPAEGSSCLYQNFDGFELRWEKHMEFSTYTFIRGGCEPKSFIKNPYTGRALSFVPSDWLKKLTGKTLAAVHVAIAKGDESLKQKDLDNAFEYTRYLGSEVAHNKAEVYTSFRIHSDGFSRILVQDKSLNSYQAGRLMQRLVEIETYRILALMSVPIARKLTPKVLLMEEQLANINSSLAIRNADIDDNSKLTELSELAAKIEQFRSDTNYRFGGTKAYYDIVNARLEQLHEDEIPGVQSLQEFIDRRLDPGMKTCDAIKERMESLSLRIAQTSSLLRTRIELSIESQNQALLSSMNHRSGMQLRMQQTVEGLSVAAISYYFMGLLGYVYDAGKTFGIPFEKATVLGVLVPFVVILTWLAIHKVMKKVKASTKSD